MELEFDKEIDAILRRAGGTGAALDAVDAAHLDADTIAAFAENALPQKAKLLYMEHFADCDRCRRLLSQSISFNSEAAVTAASTTSAAQATDDLIPWYRKLFNTPEMAMVMGALVLAFSGLLGYLATQNRTDTAAPEVSSVTDEQRVAGGPSFNSEIEAPSANTALNSAMPANAAAANTAAMPTTSATNSAANRIARTDAPVDAIAKEGLLAAAAPEPARPVAAAAPPAPMIAQPTDTGAGIRAADEKRKTEDKDAALAAKARSTEDRASRDAPPAAKKSGAWWWYS